MYTVSMQNDNYVFPTYGKTMQFLIGTVGSLCNLRGSDRLWVCSVTTPDGSVLYPTYHAANRGVQPFVILDNH